MPVRFRADPLSGCSNTGAGRRRLWDSYNVAGTDLENLCAEWHLTATDTGKAGTRDPIPI